MKASEPSAVIYLQPDEYMIDIDKLFNSNGILKALNVSKANEQAVLKCTEAQSTFLVFDGDYILENLILDCTNVQFGILTTAGTTTLKNCRVFGNASADLRLSRVECFG